MLARRLAHDPAPPLERLGRHCPLYLGKNRPQEPPREALVLDGFQSFEYSPFWPHELNLVVGSFSHDHHAFTDAEFRRSGRMTAAQKRECERTPRGQRETLSSASH